MERSKRIEYEILDLALRANPLKGYSGSANYFVAWLRRVFPTISHREFTEACGRLVTRGALDLYRRATEQGAYRTHRGGRDDPWFFYRKTHGELYCHEFKLRQTPLSRPVFERLSAQVPPIRRRGILSSFGMEEMREGRKDRQAG